ncbi:MAG: anti-sigma factor family protein [Myxococcota bacterium]
MECVRDHEEIAAFVDGELGPAERAELESHLGACAGCRDRVAAQRQLAQMFAALPEVTPPGDFEARFWARVAREAPSGGFAAGLRRLLTPGRALVLGAAAAFALVLAIGLPRAPSSPTAPAPGPTASAKPDVDVHIVSSANDFELLQDPDMDAISEVDVLEDWDDASPS